MEKEVLGGHGYVDAVLERSGVTIGCEISVTTSSEHEVNNLSKCLAAGFSHAVLLSSDQRTLEAARIALPEVDARRLRFLIPDALIAFLDELTPATTAPTSPNSTHGQRRPRGEASSNTTEASSERHLLNTQDRARYVGLAVQTLAKMRVSGDSPAYHKLGRSVVYDSADLDAWLAERKRQSTSDQGFAASTRRRRTR